MMNIFKKIKDWFTKYKKNRLYKKKLKELRKRDPFNYTNF